MSSQSKVIADNRRARHDYQITDTLEAGIVLSGTEVKALRAGLGSIKEAYAGVKGDELFLWGAHIGVYKQAGEHLQHNPTQERKLLVHKKEANKLISNIQKKGMTLVPMQMYFNPRGLVKIKLGLAEGKKQHDKRQANKERDWKRDKQRILKEKNK